MPLIPPNSVLNVREIVSSSEPTRKAELVCYLVGRTRLGLSDEDWFQQSFFDIARHGTIHELIGLVALLSRAGLDAPYRADLLVRLHHENQAAPPGLITAKDLLLDKGPGHWNWLHGAARYGHWNFVPKEFRTEEFMSWTDEAGMTPLAIALLESKWTEFPEECFFVAHAPGKQLVA